MKSLPSLSSQTFGRSQQGALTLASGGLLMGTLGVFVEEARLGALTLVFFRCLFGFLSLAAYCAWQGYFARRHFTRRTVLLATLSGVLMVTQWVGFFDAIHRTSIAVARTGSAAERTSRRYAISRAAWSGCS